MQFENSTVLITGATGFLGMHVLKHTLQAGYKTRIVVRSLSKGDHLKNTFKQYAAQIELIEIMDQLATGAYDKACTGADYVIHIASPFFMNAKNIESELLEPAVAMVKNMLSAAHKSDSVKRIALTSSLAAIVDPFRGGCIGDLHYDSTSWNPITKEQTLSGPVLGYLGSKTLAEKAAWDYVKTAKPSFDLVSFCPSLICGAPLQHVKSASDLNSSSTSIYGLFDAKEVPENQFPFIVSVTDVAEGHVRALSTPEAGGKRFIMSGDAYSFQLIIDGIREQQPSLAQRMIVGNPGKSEIRGTLATLDVKPAQEILGIEFQNWKQIVLDETVPALVALEKSWKQ